MAILDTALDHGRQYPLVAIQAFDLSDLTSGEALSMIKVPYGARVIGGGLVIDTPFDSATSDVIIVGDGVDPDRYLTQDADAAAGYFALVPTTYKYTTVDTIDITWTGTGGSETEGSGYLIVMYVVDGKANEVVPTYD